MFILGHFVEPNHQKWKVLFFGTLYGKRSRDDELDLITQKILLVSFELSILNAAKLQQLFLWPLNQKRREKIMDPRYLIKVLGKLKKETLKIQKNWFFFVRQNSTSVTMDNWNFFAVIVSTTTNWTVVIVTSKT